MLQERTDCFAAMVAKMSIKRYHHFLWDTDIRWDEVQTCVGNTKPFMRRSWLHVFFFCKFQPSLLFTFIIIMNAYTWILSNNMLKLQKHIHTVHSAYYANTNTTGDTFCVKLFSSIGASEIAALE